VASDSRIPWWLWPNLLNLDSPLLAIIWQEQFARIAGVNLVFSDRLLLFCCTWLVYCADRVLDVVDSDGRAETGRHAIHQKGRPIWLGISAIILVAALVTAIFRLNTAAWLGGCLVFALTAIHFAATHWWPRLRTRLWTKEWHVGLVFSVGCTLQIWSMQPSAWPSLLPGVLGFGALCAMSCSHITTWEVVSADRRNADSLLNAHPWFIRRLSWFDIALGLFALTIAAALGQAEIQRALCAVALSALSLAWLHDRCNHYSAEFLRAIADIGLYTPLLFFPF